MQKIRWLSKNLVIWMCMLLLAVPVLADEPVSSDVNQITKVSGSNISITHGAHLPHIVYANTETDAFNTLIGKDAGIIMEFYPWTIDFDDSQCGHFDHFYQHNQKYCGGNLPGPEINDTVMMITWEPLGNPTSYPGCNVYSGGKTNLDAIINGSCDGYIDNFATDLKNWSQNYGDVFLIRFMHEMNITDSPWWQGDTGHPAKFISAFRHVRNRFNSVGATNQYAQFVWSPNYKSNPNDAWNSIPSYYPGDAYVDWIGLSGYNWYSNTGAPWMTFSDIYDTADPNLGGTGVLRYLMCHYAKPIILAEIGSVEGPGDSQTKAAWITDTYEKIQNFPYVKAITWFNDYAYHSTNGADLRITAGSSYESNILHYPGYQNSLSNWTSAYQNAIASDVFTSTFPSLAAVTPADTYCGVIPPEDPTPELEIPAARLARPGDTIQTLVTLRDITATITLTASDLPTDSTYHFSPSTIAVATSFPSVDYATLVITVSGTTTAGDYPFTVDGDGTGIAITDSSTLKVRDTLYFTYLPLILR